MSTPIDRIEAHLERLAARERALLAVGAGALVAAAVCGGALLGAGLVSAGLQPGPALALAGGAGGLGAVGAAAVRLRGRWGPAGSLLVQARAVERLQPDLQERLATVVGRAALLRAGGSAAQSVGLLALVADAAAPVALGVPPEAAYPARAVRGPVGIAAGMLAAVWVAQLLLPVGPFDLLAIAGGASVASARLDGAAPDAAPEDALVGDIVLRYVFPDYTGIPPVEVPNSDGTIHAPTGTRVEIRARTARPFDAAALQVLEAEPLDAALTGGRDISTALTVEAAGTWRLLLFEGSRALRSADFQIVIESDGAPVVAVDRPPPPQVPLDRALPLAWSVQDDFGVDRVVLELTLPDGTVREFPLRDPLEPERELRGRSAPSPRDLGLAPGQTGTLRVVAYDNDLMGGEKRGESEPFEVTALSNRAEGARLTSHYKALRDALVPVLAGFLLDPSSPGAEPAAAARWVDGARSRLDPVRAIQQKTWAGRAPEGIEVELLGAVEDATGRLFRFVLTTWEPGSRLRVTPADAARFQDLHAESVFAIEGALYGLDLLLRNVGQQKLAEQADRLASAARDLAALSEHADASELLARLDRLDQLMQALAEAAAELGDSSLREFVNSRSDEARNLMEEARRAIAEGRMDDARALMQQLAEQLQQLSEGINDQFAQQQAGSDAASEAAEQAIKDLEQLEADQRALAEELQTQSAELGSGVAEQVALWAKADELAQRVRGGADAAVGHVGDGAGWRVDSVRGIELAREGLDPLLEAVQARDAERALEAVFGAQPAVGRGLRAARSEGARARPAGQVAPPGVGGAAEALRGAIGDLEELGALLSELMKQQASESPAVQAAAQRLAQRQAELSERQGSLEDQVQKIEQAMPMGDGRATEAMKQAGEAMERAQQALGEGQALEGQGHQAEAANRVGEARERLQQTMQQQSQMQQAQRQMQGGGAPQQPEGGQGEEDGTPSDRHAVEIPAPERFQTPEAYRRALLEGMEGDVPAEYGTLKRQYFEELVRQ